MKFVLLQPIQKLQEPYNSHIYHNIAGRAVPSTQVGFRQCSLQLHEVVGDAIKRM